MNLKELVYREKYEYTVEELIYVVETYIKLRKNRDVKIGIDPSNNLWYMSQIQQLQSAFEDAQKWLKDNHKFE